MGGTVRAVPLVAGALAGIRSGYYGGLTVRETAGAPATVRIFHGTDTSGTLAETVGLGAGESKSITLARPDSGTGALFVAITGAVEGAVRLG
jgi:hypothetical protein